MRPARNEATVYWFSYIDQVPEGEILDLLRSQACQADAQLAAITEERSTFRYAADKWSIRQLLAHLTDCERLFAFRAFWFARGFDSELPSFDDQVATLGAESGRLSWAHHRHEFQAQRAATIDFFAGLSDSAWSRTGTASGSAFTVRSLAWIAVGHAAHHFKVLSSRY